MKKENHGLTKHPLYRKWQDMKNRCYNKNVDRYKSYGGRGIKVCNEWKHSFTEYYNWCISNGWVKGLSMDRIDVNGDYKPSNCRLVELKEQGWNKRNTIYLTINGDKYSMPRVFNMLERPLNQYKLAWHHLKKGKSHEWIVDKFDLDVSEIESD